MPRKNHAPQAVPLVVPVGAAFAVPIDDRRVGICRVIAPHPKQAGAVLVAATRWVGPRAKLKSALRDPKAREVLRLTHHSWRNKPCVAWADTPPPRELVEVGVIAPSAADEKLRYEPGFVWASLALQYRAQLAWDADPDAVRAADRKRAREARAAEERAFAASAAATTATRARPGKVASLAVLARRKPFADWREPLRTRARKRINDLITALREQGQGDNARAVRADRDHKRTALSAIVRCARSFNRERELGTLEAEALDESLLAIACAVGIELDVYADRIDRARDW